MGWSGKDLQTQEGQLGVSVAGNEGDTVRPQQGERESKTKNGQDCMVVETQNEQEGKGQPVFCL